MAIAVGNDLDLLLDGTSKEILPKLRRKVFDSTSGHFLGLMLWHIIDREKERLPLPKEVQLKKVTQQMANSLVRAFEHKFYAKEQTTHRDLFRVFCENFDWLLRELRA